MMTHYQVALLEPLLEWAEVDEWKEGGMGSLVDTLLVGLVGIKSDKP